MLESLVRAGTNFKCSLVQGPTEAKTQDKETENEFEEIIINR